MALGTYGELQAAIAAWLARPGDPALVPFVADFVRLAEARINRELRARTMQQRTTLLIEGGAIALPAEFLELRTLRLEGDWAGGLELVSSEQLERLRSGWRGGRPRWFALMGGEIRVAPIPDGPYTVELSYWERIPPLTAADQSNWLLEQAPDVYLYGALMEATAFIGNDERLPLWSAAYERAVTALQTADDRATWSGSTPRARPDTARG